MKHLVNFNEAVKLRAEVEEIFQIGLEDNGYLDILDIDLELVTLSSEKTIVKVSLIEKLRDDLVDNGGFDSTKYTNEEFALKMFNYCNNKVLAKLERKFDATVSSFHITSYSFTDETVRVVFMVTFHS